MPVTDRPDDQHRDEPADPGSTPQTGDDDSASPGTAEGPGEGLSTEELERTILGATPVLTAQEVSETAGISLEDARRLWRAFGFADAGGATAFTEADVTALSAVVETVNEKVVDFDTMLKITRAVGQTMSRLADWEVATVTSMLEEARRNGGGDPEVALERAKSMLESFGPRFEEILVYSWRRHLAAAVGRLEVLDSTEEELHVAQATIGFADLVSFTALTNELGEEEIGDLVEGFESRCADVVTEHHGRVIKTLGDSVLFLCTTPEQGVETALDIVDRIGRDPRLPDVHLGMATGPVVLRMGDVYGPVVNLASRLTSVARRNRLIIDHTTADLLPPDRYATRPLPARPVRGFGDVEPVTVRRTGSQGGHRPGP